MEGTDPIFSSSQIGSSLILEYCSGQRIELVLKDGKLICNVLKVFRAGEVLRFTEAEKA